MSSRKGFTLIELLVVIAIIAILAAILFPVFAKAREKARQITCVNNMKQIGLAMMQYVQDYDENYPLNTFNWQYTVDGTTANAEWSTVVAPYIKAGDVNHRVGGVYSCPSFANPKQGNQLHVRFDIFGASNTSSRSLSVIPAPAEKIMMVEGGVNGTNDAVGNWGYPQFPTGEYAWSNGGLNAGNNYNNPGNNVDLVNGDCDFAVGTTTWAGCSQLPRYRHTNSSNFLFLDGHVKSKARGSLQWYRDIYIETISDNDGVAGHGGPTTPY